MLHARFALLLIAVPAGLESVLLAVRPGEVFNYIPYRVQLSCSRIISGYHFRIVKCSLLFGIEIKKKKSSYVFFFFIIRRFEKRTYYAMAMSVRPSFPDFFSTCFEISIWNLVYAFSRWHDMSSLSFITIGSFWPSLQPKVGQTQFLQSWPYRWRLILQIWYVDGPLYTSRHKFRFFQKSYFQNFGDYFCGFWILQSFPGFFSTCFEISFWNMVYTFSR